MTPSSCAITKKNRTGCSFTNFSSLRQSSRSSRSGRSNRSTMQCLQAPAAAACSDLSVLERQIARLNWQQQQLASSYSGCYDLEGFVPLSTPAFQMVAPAHVEQTSGAVVGNVHGPSFAGLANGWPDLAEGSQYNPLDVAVASNVGQEEESLSSSSKKRKAETCPKPVKQQESSSNGTEDSSKRIKEETGRAATADSKPNSSSKKDASGDTSKDNSKPPKTDYIHVRARRGQATDSHSLAERVRRERISERMKYLQELVPGCNKITGKAGMLDEIINYVQSLQRQVEFLSMKLAAVNPRMDFNVDNFFSREMNPVCNSNSIPIMSTAPEQLDAAYLQFNSMQQASGACDMVMNASELGLRRTVSAPVGLPADAFLGPWFNVPGSSAWDTTLHNIYNVELQQGRGSSFPVQSLPDNGLPQTLKMEM